MALDLDFFKKQLEDEKLKIEGEMKDIAHRNPDSPADWSVNYPDLNVMPAAKEEIADQEEEYENRASLESGLQSRLHDINEALRKISHGKYGLCAVGGEPIDEARLRANAAAATCIEHAS